MTKATIVLAAVALAAAVAAGSPAAVSGPRLQVLQERPAVVRGEGFKDGERVTVVLRTARAWLRTATAGDRGVVTVRFAISLPDCGRYTLQAFGSKGSRARSVAARHACADPTQ